MQFASQKMDQSKTFLLRFQLLQIHMTDISCHSRQLSGYIHRHLLRTSLLLSPYKDSDLYHAPFLPFRLSYSNTGFCFCVSLFRTKRTSSPISFESLLRNGLQIRTRSTKVVLIFSAPQQNERTQLPSVFPFQIFRFGDCSVVSVSGLDTGTVPNPLNIPFAFRHGVAETKSSVLEQYRMMILSVSERRRYCRPQQDSNVDVDSNVLAITSYSETDCC